MKPSSLSSPPPNSNNNNNNDSNNYISPYPSPLVLWSSLHPENPLHLYLLFHCLQVSYGLQITVPFPFPLSSIEEIEEERNRISNENLDSSLLDLESMTHLHYCLEKIVLQKEAEEQLMYLESLPGYYSCLVHLIVEEKTKEMREQEQQEEEEKQQQKQQQQSRYYPTIPLAPLSSSSPSSYPYLFDRGIRFASILTLKNTCLRNWRNGVIEEDKEKIRSFLLSHLLEEDDLLAKNIAVLFSIIARLDGLNLWNNILESLVRSFYDEIMNNDKSLLGIRVGYTLERVVKELSKKRLKGDRVLFEEKTSSLLPTIFNDIWYPMLQHFLQRSTPSSSEKSYSNGSSDFGQAGQTEPGQGGREATITKASTAKNSLTEIDGILLQSCINITKVIYKILLRTYEKIDQPLLESFFTYLLVVIKSLSHIEQQLRIQIHRNCDVLDSENQMKLMNINKLLKRSTQIVIDIQEKEASFAAYLLPETLNYFFEEIVSVCHSDYYTILCYNVQDEGSIALPNKYYLRIVRFLNFIISTFCHQPSESVHNLANEQHQQLCQYTTDYFEAENRVSTLITILLSNLLMIQSFELELWRDDSEEYKVSLEQVEVGENLRCASEYLFLSLLDYQGGIVCESLLELLNDYERQLQCVNSYTYECTRNSSSSNSNNNSNSYKEIFLWDCIYLGVGLTSYKIGYEYKDLYLQWFHQFLVPSMDILLNPSLALVNNDNNEISNDTTNNGNINHEEEEDQLPPILHRRLIWLLSCYQHVIQESLELTDAMYTILIRILIRPAPSPTLNYNVGDSESLGFFYHYDMATILTCIQTLSSMLDDLPIEGSKLIADNACTQDGILFQNLFQLIVDVSSSSFSSFSSNLTNDGRRKTVISISCKLEIFELISSILVSISDSNHLRVETIYAILTSLPDIWNQSLINDSEDSDEGQDSIDYSSHGKSRGYALGKSHHREGMSQRLSISASGGINHSQSSQQMLRPSSAPRLNSKGADVEIRRAILSLLCTLIKAVGKKDIVMEFQTNLKARKYQENNDLLRSCLESLQALENVVLFIEDSTKLGTNDTDMLLEQGIKLWSIYLNYLLAVKTIFCNEILSLQSLKGQNLGEQGSSSIRLDLSTVEEALQETVNPLKITSYQIFPRIHEITTMRDAAYLIDLMTIAETYLLLGAHPATTRTSNIIDSQAVKSVFTSTSNNLQEVSLEKDVWEAISYGYTESILLLLRTMPESKKNFLVNNMETLLILIPTTGSEVLFTSGVLEYLVSATVFKSISHFSVSGDHEIPDYILGQYLSILSRVMTIAPQYIDEVVATIVRKGEDRPIDNNSINNNNERSQYDFGNICQPAHYYDLLRYIEDVSDCSNIISKSFEENIIYMILDSMITLFDTAGYIPRGFLRRKTLLMCILSYISYLQADKVAEEAANTNGKNNALHCRNLRYPKISTTLLEVRLIEIFSMYEDLKGEAMDRIEKETSQQSQRQQRQQEGFDQNEETLHNFDYLLPHAFIDDDMSKIARYEHYIELDVFQQTDMTLFLRDKIEEAQILYGQEAIHNIIDPMDPVLVPQDLL